MPLDARQKSFVNRIAPTAFHWAQKVKIPAEVFIAIGASESNWGNAGTLFGIKGKSSSGGSQSLNTFEVINGQTVHITDTFAIPKDDDEAFSDFINLVSKGRYAGAWNKLVADGDWNVFLTGIVAAGYATDVNWPRNIASIAGRIRPELPAEDLDDMPFNNQNGTASAWVNVSLQGQKEQDVRHDFNLPATAREVELGIFVGSGIVRVFHGGNAMQADIIGWGLTGASYGRVRATLSPTGSISLRSGVDDNDRTPANIQTIAIWGWR